MCCGDLTTSELFHTVQILPPTRSKGSGQTEWLSELEKVQEKVFSATRLSMYYVFTTYIINIRPDIRLLVVFFSLNIDHNKMPLVWRRNMKKLETRG